MKPEKLYNVFLEVEDQGFKRFISFGCFPKREVENFQRMFTAIELNTDMNPKIKFIVEETPYHI
jgi:hypothetical protein